MVTSVFEYQDYRKFLKNFIESKRDLNQKYSLGYYSKQISTSQTYLKQVISKRRGLSLEKAKVLTLKLHLSEVESSYFLTLVMMNSAKTKELKSYFSEILIRLKQLKPVSYSQLNRHKSVFEDALTLEIYTLLGVRDSVCDAMDLQSKLKSTNSVSDIEQRLEYLIQKGYIQVDANRKVKTKNIILKHDNEIRTFYKISLDRCLSYLKEKKEWEDQEYFDSFCLILDDRHTNQIQEVLKEAKSRIIEITTRSQKGRRIGYFNSSFFFASKAPLRGD